MPSPNTRRLKQVPYIMIPTVLAFLLAHAPSRLQAQTHASRSHAGCEVGYTPRECRLAVASLQKALGRYDLDSLGEWTWILVRTVDWKQALAQKGINQNDTAFSNLTKRETFLDGSLVRKRISAWRGTSQDLANAGRISA